MPGEIYWIPAAQAFGTLSVLRISPPKRRAHVVRKIFLDLEPSTYLTLRHISLRQNISLRQDAVCKRAHRACLATQTVDSYHNHKESISNIFPAPPVVWKQHEAPSSRAPRVPQYSASTQHRSLQHPNIAWTTVCISPEITSVTVCSLHSLRYPVLGEEKTTRNTTKPERLLEPCSERNLAGGRGLTVSVRHFKHT